ncbi:MAG: hypothetical protein NTZ99_11060 [Burkholderiales bacterium]|jgi:hypothetical protein|nr:hypothetical protein [Burkholderiales bacterium]
MKTTYFSRSCVMLLSLALAGCASESELAAIRLDTSHPLYKSKACQQALSTVQNHKDAKSVSTVATPVLVFLSGGLLLPMVAANAGLDTVDRVDASNLEMRCGGKGKTREEITEKVVGGAALGLAGGAVGK